MSSSLNFQVDLATILEYGGSLLLAVVLLIVGFWLAGRAERMVISRAAANSRVDQTLSHFLGSLARYAIMAVTIIAVLNQFGVETTSLVAMIGAAGLAIGLALQGVLSNLAAGVMLILFRPFRIGHYVETGGHAGTVREIGLFTTELATPDNVQIVLPNGAVWGAPLVNYSAHDSRRVDLVFGVSYGSDLKAAEAAIRAEIEAERGRILNQPAEPFVAVTNLGDSSVDFTLRVWCAAADYWPLRFALIRAIKERFDAEGVEIPFPTRTIVGAGGAPA